MAAFPRTTALAVVLTACTFGSSTSSGNAAPASSVPARPAHGIVRNPADPAYTVRVRSDASGRTWVGSEQVSFSNADDGPLRRIWLRLWSNGIDGCDPMAITITDPSSGSWGTPSIDCTAIPVDLDAPLAPGGRTELGFDVRIHVPSRNDRFGDAGGTSLLGTPLPTLAVHDDEGWHLDPFVSFGESFYSISGRYRVTLDVPAGLETPTTGERIGLTRSGGREIRTFAADDVRDFEWAAATDFRRAQTRVGGTLIRVWYRPKLVAGERADALLDLAARSMRT